MRRLLALGFVLGLFALMIGSALALIRGAEEPPPPPPPKPVAAAPKPLRIIFPEGFTRKQMAQRITAVNGIAKQKRSITPRLRAQSYLALTANRVPPAPFREAARGKTLEGFLFPATYEFTKTPTSKQLVARQLEAFRRSWAKVDLRYARSKNLTPYDVLIIASLVEEETLVAAERPLVAAVIYNRLKARMALGIDATIRYALDIPAT